MKNAMQLKAKIKNEAKAKNILAQLLLQNYMMERFLQRVALSSYKRHFVLKGGFLIAAMVGLDSRATMDIDATIVSYPVAEEESKKMIQQIADIDAYDGVVFKFESFHSIRQDDQYGGFRAVLMAKYDGMKIPIKIDISTGDKITPHAVDYAFPLMFEQGKIEILSYNLETILAEKLETIITRGTENTRLRDFYDIYLLSKIYSKQIDDAILKKALANTATHRNSQHLIKDWRAITKMLYGHSTMLNRWQSYAKGFDYAKDIAFNDTVKSVVNLLTSVAE